MPASAEICLFQSEDNLAEMSSVHDGKIVINYNLKPGFVDKVRYLYTLPKDYIEEICKQCSLCTPLVKKRSNSVFELERQNYTPRIVERKPLYLTEDYLPPKEVDTLRRVCIVEDNDPVQLSKFLAEEGSYIRTFLINRTVQNTLIGTNELIKAIMDFRPDCLICDKGLGDLSGIRVISRIREKSPDIKTIMMTGEPDTRETHNVAHILLEKPVSPYAWEEALN